MITPSIASLVAAIVLMPVIIVCLLVATLWIGCYAFDLAEGRLT